MKGLPKSSILLIRGAVGGLTNPLGIELSLAWAAGDPHKASAALGTDSSALAWAEFVSKIEEAGLMPHLPARQKIVQELTFGQQCLTGIVITVDDEGGIDFSHHIYVPAAYDDRMKLEEKIKDRLDRHFIGVGLGTSGHWDLITEIVLPVTAAPPGRQDDLKNTA
jgi:hypothetical protein